MAALPRIHTSAGAEQRLLRQKMRHTEVPKKVAGRRRTRWPETISSLVKATCNAAQIPCRPLFPRISPFPLFDQATKHLGTRNLRSSIGNYGGRDTDRDRYAHSRIHFPNFPSFCVLDFGRGCLHTYRDWFLPARHSNRENSRERFRHASACKELELRHCGRILCTTATLTL